MTDTERVSLITIDLVIRLALELEAEGVPIILRHRNPGRRAFCPNNHDLAVFGVQKFKTRADGSKVKNGRECLPCRQERQREEYRRGRQG